MKLNKNMKKALKHKKEQKPTVPRRTEAEELKLTLAMKESATAQLKDYCGKIINEHANAVLNDRIEKWKGMIQKEWSNEFEKRFEIELERFLHARMEVKVLPYATPLRDILKHTKRGYAVLDMTAQRGIVLQRKKRNKPEEKEEKPSPESKKSSKKTKKTKWGAK